MQAAIWQHLEALGSVGSRAVGYPGHDQAARHIRQVFTDLGLKDLQVDEFTRAAPIDDGASLTVDGQVLPLACFWPNLVRTVGTPPGGITGKLFYGGKGYPNDFQGADLSECVVVLDLDCGDHFIQARSLGARAIVFIEPDQAERLLVVGKVLDAPVNIPRYWLGRQAWRTLEPAARQGRSATIHAKMTWKRATASNIFAHLDGLDPAYAAEPIVLMASYDASSAVPALAPGADQACGIATLLWLTEHFSRHPAIRPIWFVAIDAHGLSNGGIEDFVVRHCMRGRTYDDWAANFVKRDPPPRGLQINPALMIDLNLSSSSKAMGTFWDGSGTAGNDWHRNSVIKVGNVFVEQADQMITAGGYPGMQFVSGIRPLQGVTAGRLPAGVHPVRQHDRPQGQAARPGDRDSHGHPAGLGHAPGHALSGQP